MAKFLHSTTTSRATDTSVVRELQSCKGAKGDENVTEGRKVAVPPGRQKSTGWARDQPPKGLS